MDELLIGFLADIKDNGRSVLTLQTYQVNLHTFLQWCAASGLDPVRATAEHLRTYLRRYGNDRTRRLQLAGLRQFYAYLRRGGTLSNGDPTRATDGDGRLVLRMPRVKRRAPRVITDEEQDALFAAAGDDLELRTLLRLTRYSGLRISEVVGHRRLVWDPYTRANVVYQSPGLRICDVDLARKTLLVRGKGQRDDEGGSESLRFMDGHTAALVGRLIETLAHREPTAPLFQLPDGRPKGTKRAFREFRALVRRAGISRHITAHMLRHTFLTRFLENGGNLRAAQRLAGHRDLDSTLIYADYTRDEALRREFDAHNIDDSEDRRR